MSSVEISSEVLLTTPLDVIIEALPLQLKSLCKEVSLVNYSFRTCPGGSSHHHNYRGGLLVHTGEVAEFARQMSPPELKDMVTVAAVFHDYCKIFEYEMLPDGSIKSLPYRYLTGHVVGSWEFFKSKAPLYKLEQDWIDRIAHAILAHHGRLEWRSPVEPQTMEAFILHSADMLSMQKGMRELKQSPTFKHQ